MRAWGERPRSSSPTVVLTPVAAAGVVGLRAAGGARDRGAALQVPAARVDAQPRRRHRRRPAASGRASTGRSCATSCSSTPELVDESVLGRAVRRRPTWTTGRMPALLAALLIVAPETLAALNTGDLRIAPLEPPPTAPDARRRHGRALRENSTGWIPITFPLRHRGRRPASRSPTFPDLRGGFDPELAISLLIRSQRRPSGGRTVTDFEMWLHPSSRRRVPRAAHRRATSSPRLEPGVRVGLGYDGGDGNVERRDRSRAAGLARPGDDQRGDDLRSGATPPTACPTSSSGRRTTRASSSATSALDAASARAGRAQRRGGRPDRRLRPRPHEPLVPLARRERVAAARGAAVRRRPRGPADRGRGLQLLGRRRAHGAHPHRQGVQAEGAEADGALDPGQRADPRRPGPLRHPRRGAAALVGDGRPRHARRWTAPAAGSAGGPTSPAATRSASACCRRRASGSSSSFPASAAAASSTSPAGPNDRYGGVLTPDDRTAEGAVAVHGVTAFGIHELTGVPDRRRPRPDVRARDRHVVPARVATSPTGSSGSASAASSASTGAPTPTLCASG